MLQANDIPPFTGEESCEVAEKWLEIFVSSTGSFSSSGIFRLIYRKFPLGSSAREWFDSLDGSATDSWKIFESKFCDKWVTKHDQKAWNDFIHHFLEDDSIFGDGADCEASIGVIRVWVEEHRRLGRVTGCENQMLIQATMKILPPFIQAYIQAFISIRHHSFDNFCDDIKGVTPQVLEFERTRRSIDVVDRVSVMERRINEISEKVGQVFKVVCQSGHTSQPFGFNTTKSQSVTADSLSAESIDWEQCSSLTSINSEGHPGESPSVLATPTLKTNSLIQGVVYVPTSEASVTPTAINGDVLSQGDSSFQVPQEWRKPINLKTRSQLILIAQRAIEVITNYGEKMSVKLCQTRNFKAAIAIWDRFNDSRHYLGPLESPETDSLYDLLFLGYAYSHSYAAYLRFSDLSCSIKYWSSLAEQLAKPSQVKITISDHDFYLTLNSSGAPSVVGGLFGPDLDEHNIVISSVRTVLFMTLSTYLAECTGDRKYMENAVLSATCIKTWALDPTTFLIKDCLIDAVTAQERSGWELSCHLTGVTIEGFTILAGLTQNDEWRTLAIKIARAAMLHSGWHSTNGILSVCTERPAPENTNNKTFRGLLNRGLMVAYERNRFNAPFCNLVRSYINVQFNALYELSRFQSSYGVDWRGPYVGPFAHAQIAALDTILAAIGVADV